MNTTDSDVSTASPAFIAHTHQDIILEETLKKLYLYQASKRANHNATVDILWAVFEQSSLATPTASIAKSIRMLAQTTLKTYTSTIRDVFLFTLRNL